jgi:3-phenylpropionate/trans-cinnamate dioxygenase ferredoxin component
MTRMFVKVARESEIEEGMVRVFEVEDARVAVCRAGGVLYALENTCTHDDGPLGEGFLDGFEIECPRHGARFDVRTGAVCRMPAVVPVQVFPLRVEDGNVLVELEVD